MIISNIITLGESINDDVSITPREFMDIFDLNSPTIEIVTEKHRKYFRSHELFSNMNGFETLDHGIVNSQAYGKIGCLFLLRDRRSVGFRLTSNDPEVLLALTLMIDWT